MVVNAFHISESDLNPIYWACAQIAQFRFYTHKKKSKLKIHNLECNSENFYGFDNLVISWQKKKKITR